ncbi:hypothetical protein M0R89_20750 (plasmid) [Halorussus limi]|uniref:Uncharacterized protein n=1 Tax=Halorussus limi TaxID=2938695 RepID=A0A8U0I247_9EURY|nr:hypothetical protein [Halorussus limi]UPV76951.1 hypothetical protein M0R89_20750 [Halorussus limi]
MSGFGELESDWLVSYAELPGRLREEYRVVGHGEKDFMGNGSRARGG